MLGADVLCGLPRSVSRGDFKVSEVHGTKPYSGPTASKMSKLRLEMFVAPSVRHNGLRSRVYREDVVKLLSRGA